MPYKIEIRYVSRWDDAEWTEEADDGPKPMRFASIQAAQSALAEFFAEVKIAVADGNMDDEEKKDDYRIVESGD